jgi:hypothetical protein
LPFPLGSTYLSKEIAGVIWGKKGKREGEKDKCGKGEKIKRKKET